MRVLANCLGQVHRATRPWLDDGMIMSAPAAVDEPHPKYGALLARKFEGESEFFGRKFDAIPAAAQIRRVVAAKRACINGLNSTHVGMTLRSLEHRPRVSLPWKTKNRG